MQSLLSASDNDFLEQIMNRLDNGSSASAWSATEMEQHSNSTTGDQANKHTVFLRLSWLLLTRYGRREALPMLFHLARTFYPSPSASITGEEGVSIYNESLIYFWINTVHFAIMSTWKGEAAEAETEKISSFTTFMERFPYLANENYVFTFYSRHVLMSEQAKENVVLPDLQPMPCIVRVTDRSMMKQVKDTDSVRERLTRSMPRVQTLSDKDFYRMAREKRLPCWGHQVKLRLIYCLLLIHGRQRGGVDEVLKVIKSIEQGGFNVTVTYFWIQLTTFHMMKVLQQLEQQQVLSGEDQDRSIFGNLFPAIFDTVVLMSAAGGGEKEEEKVNEIFERSMCFDEFIRYEMDEDLTDVQLIEKYYPKETLLNLHDQHVTLPTIKPLPNIIVN